MTKLHDEVLAANAAYAKTSATRPSSGAAAGARLRHPHLHGCAARSGQVRRPRRRRRPRHPQRRGTRQRRRHPLAGDLPQAARDQGVVRHPPHRLRHGALHRRDHARPARAEPGDREIRRQRWNDPGTGRARAQGDFIDWLTIRDQAESVAADIGASATHPLVPGESRSRLHLRRGRPGGWSRCRPRRMSLLLVPNKRSIRIQL